MTLYEQYDSENKIYRDKNSRHIQATATQYGTVNMLGK